MATLGAIGAASADPTFYIVSTPLSSPVVATEGASNVIDKVSNFGINTWFTTNGVTANLAASWSESPQGQYARPLPFWAIDFRGYFVNNATSNVIPVVLGVQFPTPGIDVSGSISGQTQENGVAVPGRLVVLKYRPNRQIISQKYSDASGNFTFSGLEHNSSNYYVEALDNTPLSYDAVIHDTIQAV